MKVLIDGKEVKVEKKIKLSVDVGPLDGITSESTLEISINSQGITVELVEVTDRCTGSSAEITRTYSKSFDQLIDCLEFGFSSGT